MSHNIKKLPVFLIVVAIFGAGFATAWFSHRVSVQVTQPVKLIHENSSQYKFINPLILIQIPNEDTSLEFSALKNKVTSYSDTAIAQHQASDVSVFFRELNSTRWTSINGDKAYSPASMLKVASMIAFLRAVEVNPSLINANVKISPEILNLSSNQDYYKPVNPVVPGKIYSA